MSRRASRHDRLARLAGRPACERSRDRRRQVGVVGPGPRSRAAGPAGPGRAGRCRGRCARGRAGGARLGRAGTGSPGGDAGAARRSSSGASSPTWSRSVDDSSCAHRASSTTTARGQARSPPMATSGQARSSGRCRAAGRRSSRPMPSGGSSARAVRPATFASACSSSRTCGWITGAGRGSTMATSRSHSSRASRGRSSPDRFAVAGRACRFGPAAIDDLPAPFLAALRLVAARAHDELGADRLEWGVADGEVTILQLGASGGVSVASAMAPDDGRFRGRKHVALAGVLATRRGPLADRLLTPWAAWLPSSPVASPHDPRSLLDRASRLSEEVAASAGLSVANLRDVLASGEASVPDGQFDARQAVAAAALIADADGLASTLAERGARSPPPRPSGGRTRPGWSLRSTPSRPTSRSPSRRRRPVARSTDGTRCASVSPVPGACGTPACRPPRVEPRVVHGG